MQRLFSYLMLMACMLSGSLAHAEPGPNPQYQQWAAFKVGSWSRVLQTSYVDGKKTETELTTTLVELTREKAVVEIKAAVVAEGLRSELAPTRRDYPATIDIAPVQRVAEGLPRPIESWEQLTPAGKPVTCRTREYTVQADADTIWTKTWLSEQIPGGLVRTESRVDGPGKSTTTMTLLAFEAK